MKIWDENCKLKGCLRDGLLKIGKFVSRWWRRAVVRSLCLLFAAAKLPFVARRRDSGIVEFMEQPVSVLISRTLRENKNRRKLETRLFLIYVNSSTI